MEKVIEEDREQVVAKEKVVEAFADSCDGLKKELKKATNHVEKLKADIEKLQERLDKKGIVVLEGKIASLEKDTSDRNIAIEKLKQENRLLKEDLEKLNVFKKPFVRSLLDGQRSCLELPFQVMSVDKMNEMIGQCDTYGKGDADIQKLGDDLKVKLALKQRFDTIYALLTVPYDGEKVFSARTEVENWQPLSEVQKAEVDTLGFYLARYKWGVKELQNVINEINKKMKNYREEVDSLLLNSCRNDMKDFFNKVGVKDNEDAYFFVIPYLKERYAKYKQSILENPLKQIPDLEEEIKKIKTE